MNRAERRRQAREQAKSEKMISLKASNIAQMKQEATSEAVDLAFCMMLGLSLMTARDKLGFGKKRLYDFYENILELYDSYNKGYLNFSDIMKTLYDEVDFKVAVDKNEKVSKVWESCIERRV